MSSVGSWVRGIACVCVLSACSTDDGVTPNNPGASTVGASGSTSLSGNSNGAAASLGGGGQGSGVGGNAGSLGAVPVSGELVAELCLDPWNLTILDDDHIFAGCFESVEVDYNLVERFTLQQLTSSGLQLIATSEKPLRMAAMDATSYYVHEYGLFDDNGSTWSADIRRIYLGSTELLPFASAKDTNNDPSILQQTDDLCVISQPSQSGLLNTTRYFASATVNTKATGDARIVLPQMEGFIVTSWLEGEDVAFVVDTEEGPFIHRGALAAGMATSTVALPNLCRGFVRSQDGFLAVCGDTSDLVRLDAQGAILATLTTGLAYGELHDFDRVYWSSSNAGNTSIHAVSEDGVHTELRLVQGSYVYAITPKFAYVRSTENDRGVLRRVPLADVK